MDIHFIKQTPGHFIFLKQYFLTVTAWKAMLPVLLCQSTMSEVDVGGITVEATFLTDNIPLHFVAVQQMVPRFHPLEHSPPPMKTGCES